MDFRGLVCNNAVCICLCCLCFTKPPSIGRQETVGGNLRSESGCEARRGGWEMWESDSERQESELCVESTGPRCGVLVICVILFLKSQFSVKSVHTWLSRFYHERRCFDSFQLNPVLGLVEYIKDIGVIHILSKYEPFPPNYLTHLPLVWKCSFSSLQTDYLLQQELSLLSFI